jgi:hypothetical protein
VIDVAKTRQVVVRMEEDLVQRLDAHVERLKAEKPGSDYSRADAVRILVTAGLVRAEAAASDKAKAAKKRA